jgi:hypothetical protein
MEVLGPIALIVVGLAVAFMGRKLVWLFVAAAGFAIAYQLTSRFLGGLDPTLNLIISVGVGVVAGYFATKFGRLLIMIAGFILVGNAALTIGGLFGITSGFWALLIFVVGGLLALGLIRWMFALALIIISAIGGASMVVDGAEVLNFVANNAWIGTALGAVIVVLGFLYQYRVWKAEGADEQAA